MTCQRIPVNSHKRIYCLLRKLTLLAPPLSSLTSGGPEAQKQMGLCHPRDPGPAHHHHHHRYPALGCVCDHHRQRHQDHGHLGGGHHPEEGKAVTPNWAGVSSCLSETGRVPVPVPLINVKKKSKRYREGTTELMDVSTQMPPPTSISSWTVIEGFAALFLWDCICTGMSLSQKSLLNSVQSSEWKTCCAQTVHC